MGCRMHKAVILCVLASQIEHPGIRSNKRAGLIESLLCNCRCGLTGMVVEHFCKGKPAGHHIICFLHGGQIFRT